MVKVLSVSGEVLEEIELPSIFKADIRPDLIKRAVVAIQSHRLQPKGVDKLAGKRRSAESFGPGYGVSRVPRIATGRAAFAPGTVGGRKAHPPKVEKVLEKRINKKERIKATLSALAATAVKEIVEARGHVISDVKDVPIIVEDKLEELKTAKEVKEAFKSLGVWSDILRAKERKVRSGKGKMRGRRYYRKKSALIVVSEPRKPIKFAARNFAGVDVVDAMNLCVEDLAPGTHYGRLTIYTKGAILKLEERFRDYIGWLV